MIWIRTIKLKKVLNIKHRIFETQNEKDVE